MRDADEIVAIHEELSKAMLQDLLDANRTDEETFEATLEKWNWQKETQEKEYNISQRILVVGGSSVKLSVLEKVALDLGINPDIIDFELGYKTDYRFSTLKGNDNYSDVLFGPMPHSQDGKGSSSSIITEMENHPELWPNPIRLGISGSLKITKESFGQGLLKTKVYATLKSILTG